MFFNLFCKKNKTKDTPPIFVRGMSRSGGTLLVTILDSHPEIAMSYELYSGLLCAPNDENSTAGTPLSPEYTEGNREGYTYDALIDIRELLITAKSQKDMLSFLKERGNLDLRTFVARMLRSGLDYKDFLKLLANIIHDQSDLCSPAKRLEFIEMCCSLKQNYKKKSRWGVKCSSQFAEYTTLWPNAYYINIIRDGRDVLASHLNSGSFNISPEEVGLAWSETIVKFRELVEKRGFKAHEVFYEQLVMNPETEIKKICQFLDVDWTPRLLNFHKQNLTIYKKPMGHLSRNRIVKPIDSSKVGRWKDELSSADLEKFYSTGKELMLDLGYL